MTCISNNFKFCLVLILFSTENDCCGTIINCRSICCRNCSRFFKRRTKCWYFIELSLKWAFIFCYNNITLTSFNRYRRDLIFKNVIFNCLLGPFKRLNGESILLFSSEVVFFRSPELLIGYLTTVEKVLFEITPYDSNTDYAEFEIDGIYNQQ